MKHSFIQEILRQADHSQIELLEEYNEKNILEMVCAFLNTDGGWIIIGISKNNVTGIQGNASGLADEIEELISNQIFPQPLIYTKCETYKEHQIILINVMKGPRQPYTYGGKYYFRKNNMAKVANTDEISLLLRRATETTSTWEKLTAINVDIEDLSMLEIDKTINYANKIGKGDQLPKEKIEFLSYFQLFEYNSVKNGAVLLFGKFPIKFLPQARIRITVMPYGKTGKEYSDSKLIEFNLLQSFEEVQRYFKQTLPMVSKFESESWDREDRFIIPLDVLDEAIVNAMVHRDYGDYAGEITINIMPDRMEIINSGEIPEHIISGKNKIEAHHSILRNPTIAHIFYLRGKMEKLGRGLHLIINRSIGSGLKKPEWRSKDGYTTLTLYSVPEEITFNSRMFKFMSAVYEQRKNEFTREDYEKFLDHTVSEKTARIDLNKLLTGNWIEKIGDGPSTKYLLTSKKLPDSYQK